MKIKSVRVRKVLGTMPTDGTFWEERLLRPIDVYPEFRAEGAGLEAHGGKQTDGKHLKLTQFFVDIESDDGVVGCGGPIAADPARLILTQLAPQIIGRDPLAIEYLWDIMHRRQVHGRQGDPMIALSAIDCALWDLKGKAFNQPVWRILGGPTRESIPAYASMLGYAVEDLGKVRERAQACKEKGFTAQKWFIRHGPMSGHDGLKRNVALVKTLREALGDDYDIMIDCWQSLNFDYAVDFTSRIEEYRPRWIEECFMPDRIESHVKLKAKTRIPLSGAEHEYTRWNFMRFLEKGALDIYQPDPYWCGGLSETLKIATLTTAHDLICIPHGHSTPIGIHFSVTQSPMHTPYQEYLVKWNDVNMFFLKNPPWPVKGSIHIPTGPGVGMELDKSKIESEEELRV
ncbi:MAG TPA: enolase C-terminal domain-like protein [Magnetospirillaceae bacterium]|jgi:L-alanine-DL-glutamate epimerase-like enolase superfamily enzyme